MTVNFRQLADIGAEEAKAKIESFLFPVVLLDGDLTVIGKNRPAYGIPGLPRCGADAKKLFSGEDLEKIGKARRGDVHKINIFEGFDRHVAAVCGSGTVFLLLDSVPADIKDCVEAFYSPFSGYDTFVSGNFTDISGDKTDRQTQKIYRRLSELTSLMIGAESDMRVFNAIPAVRGVLTAAEEAVFASGKEYSVSASAIPHGDLAVFGSESAFAAALATALKICVDLSSDMAISFCAGTKGETAEFTLSARVTAEKDELDPVFNRKRSDPFGDPHAMTALDCYLIKLLACGNFWEPEFSVSTLGIGGSELVIRLCCPLAGCVPEESFALADSVSALAKLAALRELTYYLSDD
ncbi:MAG: hypothetical protein J5793_01160 [Clostridia bacterium]|nr:hypothetical protein [Clostridia bacterium]